VYGDSGYTDEAMVTTLAPPPPPPPVPKLRLPAYWSMVYSLTPRSEWHASAGASSYGIQVATDYGFISLVIDEGGITEHYIMTYQLLSVAGTPHTTGGLMLVMEQLPPAGHRHGISVPGNRDIKH